MHVNFVNVTNAVINTAKPKQPLSHIHYRLYAIPLRTAEALQMALCYDDDDYYYYYYFLSLKFFLKYRHLFYFCDYSV